MRSLCLSTILSEWQKASRGCSTPSRSLVDNLVHMNHHQIRQQRGWFCKPIPVSGNKIQRLHPPISSLPASLPPTKGHASEDGACITVFRAEVPAALAKQQGAVLSAATAPWPGWTLARVCPEPCVPLCFLAVRRGGPGPLPQGFLQRRQLSRHQLFLTQPAPPAPHSSPWLAGKSCPHPQSRGIQMNKHPEIQHTKCGPAQTDCHSSNAHGSSPIINRLAPVYDDQLFSRVLWPLAVV